MTGGTIQQLLLPPHDALLQQRMAERLRLIATQRPTAESRAEVALALGLRWWGIREAAIAVMGKWGTKHDRVWLTERARRPLADYGRFHKLGKGSAERWHHLETVACRQAVAPLLGAEDTQWVLDLWFADFNAVRGLHEALPRLAAEPILDRIEAEIASGNKDQIVTAMCLFFNTPQITTRETVLAHYAQSKDPHTAKWAKSVLWSLQQRRTARPAP